MANDALINLVDWCKRERASLRQRLELMKAGKFRIALSSEAPGGNSSAK